MRSKSQAPYLVVATSGRALAASAARGGHRSVVLDCFADTDTRKLARRCCRVAHGATQQIDPRALLAAANKLAPARACAGLVYGSGLEDQPQHLAELGARRHICGNAPETVASVKDPLRFFGLLDSLGIEHPSVSIRRPAQVQGWLVKHRGGAGGGHVRPARRDDSGAGCYFQRFESGRALSALFLADASHARVIGYNEQLPAAAAELPTHRFGGLVGGLRLAPSIEARVRAIVAALVAALGLKGLNGIDFIQRAGRVLVLEVNPRPTAALDLYDADYPEGLFDRHLRACDGELPGIAGAHRAVRGLAVVYAPAPLRIDADCPFPVWCSDLPSAGTSIGAGDPLCTVHAEGGAPEQVRRQLRQRQNVLRHALFEKAA